MEEFIPANIDTVDKEGKPDPYPKPIYIHFQDKVISYRLLMLYLQFF